MSFAEPPVHFCCSHYISPCFLSTPPLSFSLSLSLAFSFSLSLSLYLCPLFLSFWLQDTCHLMPFTKYSLLDQSYFFTSYFTSYLSIAHIKFSNYSPTIFYDYHPQSCLKNIFFRSRANRRLVFRPQSHIERWGLHGGSAVGNSTSGTGSRFWPKPTCWHSALLIC